MYVGREYKEIDTRVFPLSSKQQPQLHETWGRLRGEKKAGEEEDKVGQERGKGLRELLALQNFIATERATGTPRPSSTCPPPLAKH